MSFASNESVVTSLRSTPSDVGEKNKNTPHYHFIHSMILPSTMKLQKELNKSRKFKVRTAHSLWSCHSLKSWMVWIQF